MLDLQKYVVLETLGLFCIYVFCAFRSLFQLCRDMTHVPSQIVGTTVVCSLFSQVSYVVLLVMFVSLMGAGSVLFSSCIFSLYNTSF